ncbi:alanine:cation symporter family protein [Mycoplasma sp. SG1]|uniref:alanine:cation symporter family protein n=1 Tax=Mycoplasma sp. SG1 TaxID=2810348 RepID=UPI0020243430|nr:alanine:cation symporter family protein [Mycoplasma sp. SG1]URM52858.1 alanine:cation symporter family protein [Mycoplasma sp. SG1]
MPFSVNIVHILTNNYYYPIFLFLVSIIFTFALRGFQFSRFAQMARCFFLDLKSTTKSSKKTKSVSSFAAVMTSLATRMGGGNIVGIALGLAVGGPGILVWMWIFGAVCVGIGFGESVLSQVYKRKDPEEQNMYVGGTAYYIRYGLGRSWAWLAIFFAFLSFFSKGFIIFSTNISALFYDISLAVSNGSKVDIGSAKWIISGVFAIFTAICVWIWGLKGVIKLSSKVAPLFILLYLSIAVVVILVYITSLPAIFGAIFGSAFSVKAFTGAGLFLAFRTGAIRGIYSNEAGQGSGTSAAATADVDHPAKQGFAQAFGIFFDTIFFCTAGGLLFLIILYVNNGYDFSNFWHSAPGGDSYTIDLGRYSSDPEASNHLGELITWLTGGSLFGAPGSVGFIIGTIFFSIILFYFIFNSTLGGVLIAEFNLLFMCRGLKNEKHRWWIVLCYRVIVPLLCICAPLVVQIGASSGGTWSIFDISDFMVMLCFITNVFVLCLLMPVIVKTYKDFGNQIKLNKKNLRSKYYYNPKTLKIKNYQAATEWL